MKSVRNSWLFLLAPMFLFTAACNLDLPDDEAVNSGPVVEYEWDGNTLYAYEDGDLIWYEVYEGGKDGHPDQTPAQVSHFLANKLQLWTKRYLYNASGSVTFTAYYSGSSSKAEWAVQNIYDSENRIVHEISWATAGTSPVLESHVAYAYESGESYERIYRFIGASELEYAWTYEYASQLISRLSQYEGTGGSAGTLSGYILYSYDADDRPSAFTGYGDIAFEGFETDETCTESKAVDVLWGGGSAQSRALLVLPTVPDPPAVPSVTLTDASPALSWRASWVWDDAFSGEEGNFSAVLQNAAEYPELLYRHFNESGTQRDIKIEITYGAGNAVTGKKISVNGSEALSIAYGYTGEYLSSIACSGPVMPLPAELSLSYDSHDLPSGIVLSSNGTILRSLTYTYQPGLDLSTVSWDNFAQSIFSITERNGDGDIISDYAFAYDASAKMLTMTVSGPDAVITGRYTVYYDADGLSAGIVCYSSTDGGQSYDALWDYSYGYNDAKQRVNEFKEDLEGLYDDMGAQDIAGLSIGDFDGIPAINESYGIDMETLFEDIRNYIPF